MADAVMEHVTKVFTLRFEEVKMEEVQHIDYYVFMGPRSKFETEVKDKFEYFPRVWFSSCYATVCCRGEAAESTQRCSNQRQLVLITLSTPRPPGSRLLIVFSKITSLGSHTALKKVLLFSIDRATVTDLRDIDNNLKASNR
ncbi:hypothetical protein NQ318_017465 [Aromia moschata]|uniref:Uncharacterized protein n=1 Tax=Aromia moschata TaxID=1265417 RepID=A0AAV8Z553_9CUCU|nr:hypothetical protein NQ318_017465 [Aromia moschata]